MKRCHILRTLCSAASILLLTCTISHGQAADTGHKDFDLQDGDRVVFYGDSITEQQLYTADVEEYALTRFPARKIAFWNGGVGGDRVSGGWAGPIDLRLHDDVFAFHPTVVTVMLGMNDGMVRPYNQQIFESFSRGYRYLVDQIIANNPKIRLTLIQSSPYDDVTREPDFSGGYNSVLLKYGEFVGELAREKHALVVDFNHPVVDVLTRTKSSDPALSTLFMLDRVHPGEAIHWIMAETLLKAWNAPSTVTRVVLSGEKAAVLDQTNTAVSGLRRVGHRLEWSQADRALPLPLPSGELDPVWDSTVRNSDFIDSLDREDLKIPGLAPGSYELRIDGMRAGTFRAEEFASGINLAQLETPMLQQAEMVGLDAREISDLDMSYLGLIRLPMNDSQKQSAEKLAGALVRARSKRRADAQPMPHRYEVTPDNEHK
ncbi:MAG: SGNH/GDSL hydrolase family protein [Candidatus Acidiferrales bacterium]